MDIYFEITSLYITQITSYLIKEFTCSILKDELFLYRLSAVEINQLCLKISTLKM